jgi:hypothetical protein
VAGRHSVKQFARFDRRTCWSRVARSGFNAVAWSGFMKTTGAIVLSPLLGFVLALVLVAAVSQIFIRSTPFAVGKLFRTVPSKPVLP